MNQAEKMKGERMKTTNTQDSHSEAQAKAQVESIVEMVNNLSRDTAAQQWVDSLETGELITELREIGEEFDAELPEDELREKLVELLVDGNYEPKGFGFDEDAAQERIQEDPLSIQVRSDWYSPGADESERKPFEFEILLCTGGPACRLIGELDEHLQPDRVRIQHQDWGTPWTEYFPSSEARAALLTYCQQFYFGE